jgi:hypothetical protein
MPARQDQTLQIFLIVFIFLFLVSAVLAYLGWKGYGEAEQRATANETKAKDADTTARNLTDQNQRFRAMMGFGEADSSEAVENAFKGDMDKFAAGVGDEKNKSYRKVLETVHTEGVQTAARETKLKDDLKERDNRLAAIEATHAAQIASFEKQATDAKADAAKLKEAFDQDRAKMETAKTELQKSLDTQRTKYEKDIKTRDEQIATVTKANEKLEHANQIFKGERKLEPGAFEVADGRISWVNQNGTVWINLGSADSLRRQVTFSVYDADQHDAAKADKKGSIEVTRILGEHMAEARITEDDPKNPIITGDQVYSQVWHRGKKLRFALTGVIDFDNDGLSDMELARDLIVLNGGIVDAFVGAEGKMEGEMTANTRYLVLGDFPEAATQATLEKTWEDMNKEAIGLGIETITINEFLGQMGYKPQDRSVSLGEGAKAADFPATTDTPNAAAPLFRPRTPNRTPPQLQRPPAQRAPAASTERSSE